MDLIACPLCTSRSLSARFKVLQRDFFRCSTCDLIYVDPDQRLSVEEERARYQEHNNDVHDPRYREFVSPLMEAVCEKIPPGSSGLDFGAGTGPVLAVMAEEKRYLMEKYDPLFWPNLEALESQYDFIFASEVAEHFSRPKLEFRRLRQMLRPDAPLGVMTLMHDEITDFSNWYYLRDPTHVCAYSRRTFAWICDEIGFQAPAFRGRRIVLLRPISPEAGRAN